MTFQGVMAHGLAAALESRQQHLSWDNGSRLQYLTISQGPVWPSDEQRLEVPVRSTLTWSEGQWPHPIL